MGTFTLAFVIGMAISFIFTVIWALRAYFGIAPVMRNADGSVYRFVPTMIGFFILWSGIFFVVALVPIFIIDAIG